MPNDFNALTHAPSLPPELPRPPPSGSALVSPRWLLAAEPTPVVPPKLPPDLPEMPTVVRVHACLDWYAKSTVYALSPGGHLAALLRLVIRLVIVVGILALAATAMLTCVAMVLGVIIIITGQIVTILVNVLYALVLVVAILGVCMLLLLTIRVFLRAL